MYKKNYTRRIGMPKRHIAKIWLMMRLTTVILIATFMQVSAAGFAQKISLSKSNAPLNAVLREIKIQTGYNFLIKESLLKKAKPVTIRVNQMELSAVLQQLFEDQPLNFTIDSKTVIVTEKEKSFIERIVERFQEIDVKGRVVDENNQPLVGASVQIKWANRTVITNEKGEFSFTNVDEKAVLVISYVGYQTTEIAVKKEMANIKLAQATAKLEEVSVTINTGYQYLPKERATGSFSTIDNSILNKQVTTNILERLPAMVNGVTVNKGISGEEQIMIRGISTINGPKAPLIILDDFPYEGNLGNINPNMVEDVTVLKDAAAASIWGARAANGVIVITTKKARQYQPIKIDFTANASLSGKPDLGYIRQISSTDFIEVEQQLFSQGFYDSNINSPAHPVLTPVVDLLNKAKNGRITSEQAQQQIANLKQIDMRDQYQKYMYQNSLNKQYALNLSSASKNLLWTSTIGYDDNTGNLDEKYNRLNVRLQNIWKPTEKLSLTTGLFFTQANSQSGKSSYGSITISGNWQVPYLQFADNNGNAVVMPSVYDQNYKESLAGIGLLDWNYYPLNNWQYNTTKSNSSETILQTALGYKIIKGLDAELKYQYQRTQSLDNTLFDENSYYARHYINNYAVLNSDGSITFAVPKGGILDKSNSLISTHNVRGQLNYNYSWLKHSVRAIGGGEIRETSNQYEGNRYYGYNTHNLTSNSIDFSRQYPSFITGDRDYIPRGQSMREKNTRFVSIYTNAAYTYNKKYTISGSVRRDASNLFGLKTNDQWNPFWSAGFGWNVSDESFYSFPLLPYLKLRGSYGFNGNIDPAMVAATTIVYDPEPSILTGSAMARIDQYYNPNLRWETSRIINLALDFATQNQRISGSIDFFSKKGTNLFGTAPLDYTTGITTMLWNVAGMKGRGLDLELKTVNVNGQAFKWNSILNFSIYHDEVTDYYRQNTFASDFVSTTGAMLPVTGIKGLPVYSILAYPWGGLDPATGDPLGYLDGKVSKDYSAITGSEKGIEDLTYFGSAIPTYYGSFTNSFNYRNFGIDIGITYKLGYFFRRNSINYTNLFVSRRGHSDYEQRWQKPGDETLTYVPSNPYSSNSARDQFYNGSSVLVEKGDHIRLQYINLNYELRKENLHKLPVKSIQLYTAINNLGIIWRANNQNLDPDYSWGDFSLRPVTSYSLGIRAQF